jgi:hypothetical protein
MAMPLSPDRRKVLHYFGYIYPIVFIGLGAAGLIGMFIGRTPEGRMIVGLLGAAGVALGSFLAWRHSKQDISAPMPTFDDYPPLEQARQIRTSMRMIAIVTILFAGFMAYQVMQVEYGWARSVRVWEPVANLYNSFGFWPAVLCVPVLGSLILLALGWKLHSIGKRMPPTIRQQ